MHLSLHGRALLTAALCVAGAERRLAAQIDYRNLDDDRPTRVEDAYPTERYAFELLVPYAFERGRGEPSVHASVLELAYGAFPNAQFGVKAPLAAVRDNGTTVWSLSGLRAFALYNFNTETRALPAFSLRVDAGFPVGAFGGERTQVAVKGIVTRSWGRSRLHLNGAVRLGPDGPGPVVEALDRWWYGAAVDRTLFRQSVLVVGEVYARRSIAPGPTELNVSFGLRWQWRPTAVIDLGVSRGLRRGLGPDYAVTLGISKAFAIAGLMPHDR